MTEERKVATILFADIVGSTALTRARGVGGGPEGNHSLVGGEPVIAAARIRGAAEPGEIAVGALTHRLTTGGGSFGEGRTFEAKGIGRLRRWPAIAPRCD